MIYSGASDFLNHAAAEKEAQNRHHGHGTIDREADLSFRKDSEDDPYHTACECDPQSPPQQRHHAEDHEYRTDETDKNRESLHNEGHKRRDSTSVKSKSQPSL